MEVVWIEETPKTIIPQKTIIKKKRRKVKKEIETWQTLVTQMSFEPVNTPDPGLTNKSKMDIRYVLN